MKKILMFLGIAALFASCQSDEATNGNDNSPVQLSAVIDNSDEITRVGLNNLSNVFEAGDKITVWSDNTTAGNAMTVAAGTGAQLLTGTAPTRNNVFYAAGINSGNNIQSDLSTDGSLHLWFPRPNKAIFVSTTQNELSNTEFPLAGKTEYNGTQIVLRNVACLLKMQVTNSSGKAINSISIEDADGTSWIKGQYAINMYNLFTTARAATEQATTFGETKVLTQDVTIANGATSYVYFVVSDLKDFTPKITFYEGTGGTSLIKSITTNSAVATLHGRIVNMGSYTVPVAETGRWAGISANYVFHPGSLAPDDYIVTTPARFSDGLGGSQTDPVSYFDNGPEFLSLMTEEQMVAAIQSYYIDESIQWKNHSGVTHTGGIWLKKNAGSLTWTSSNSRFANTTLQATITDSNWDTYKADIEANYFFVPFIGQLEGSGTTYTCTNEGTGVRLVSSTAKQYGGVTSYANAELYYNINGLKGVYRQGITTTTPWGGALKSNGEFITKE